MNKQSGQLTQYLNLSQYSFGIDHILERLMYSFDGNLLTSLKVLGTKDMAISTASYLLDYIVSLVYGY